MSDFDTAWKEALDVYFEPFMAFFFGEAHGEIDWTREIEMLDKELRQITPESEGGRRMADKLVKVWRTSGQDEWVLVHIEVQSQQEKTSRNGCSSITIAFLIAIIDDARRASLVRLVKGLYARGLEAEQIRQLYRLMEAMMSLPKPLAELA